MTAPLSSALWGSGDAYAEMILKTWLGPPDKQASPGEFVSFPLTSGSMYGRDPSGVNQPDVYGYKNETNGSSLATPALLLQGTSYSKKVELVELSGSATTFSVQTWLRVYREVYAPSMHTDYRGKIARAGISIPAGTPLFPQLPFSSAISYPNGADILKFGRGSTLRIKQLFPNWNPSFGPIQIFWLAWRTVNGNARGAIFDFAQIGTEEWYETPGRLTLDLTPASGPGYNSSKSGVLGQGNGKSWSTIGLGSSGPQGYSLGTITGDEFAGKTYYLRDVAGSNYLFPSASQLSSDNNNYIAKKLTVITKEQIVIGASTGNGKGTVKLAEFADDTKNAPENVSLVKAAYPNGINVLGTDSGSVRLYFQQLYAKLTDTGNYIPLFFEKEAALTIGEMIDKFKTEEGNTDVDFTQSGGVKIITKGDNQNYVAPSYQFAPEADFNEMLNGKQVGWRPSKSENSDSFLPCIVVNGENITANSLGESGWIDPYRPPAGPVSDAYYKAARRAYWYVLPLQQRDYTQVSNTATPNGQEFNSDASVDAFMNGENWVQGLHWGKFLKKNVPSYNQSLAGGFTENELEDDPDQAGSKRTKNGKIPLGAATKSTGYTNTNTLNTWLENLAKEATVSVNKRLVETKLTAYVVSPFYGRTGTTMYKILNTFQITLANIQGLAYGGGRIPKTALTSFANLTAQGGKRGTESTDSTYTDGGGGYTGTPKDWRKIISESLDKLVTPSSVVSLTGVDLTKFIGNQAKIGAPIPLMKEIFLAKLLEARIISIMNTDGISRKAASQKVKTDPVYLALVGELDKIKKKDFAGSTGGTNSGSSAPNESKKEQTIRIRVFRGLPGYVEGSRVSTITEKPELVQVYEAYGKDGQLISPTEGRRFVFPLTPREVNYTGIGTRWTEIERTGNYPIVDWQGFQLLKISFNFDLVNREYAGNSSRGPATGFGYLHDCEKDIETLRQMAQTPYPVTFLNMDKFMENEVRWPTLTEGRGIEFVIAEFNVTAVQRTPVDGIRATGAVANRISRATCSMTLQEIPIENVNIVQMPRIQPCFKILPSGKKTYDCTDKEITKEKFKTYLLLDTGVNL